MRIILLLSLFGVSLGCSKSADSAPKPEKPFLFGIDGARKPYSYEDERTGEIKGFLHDVARAVCDLSGRECDIIYSKFNNKRCFDPEDDSGTGLNDRHFDACLGWADTSQRRNIFKFSSPMLNTELAQMFVTEESRLFDAENLRGRKIGFRQFSYMDEVCLKKAGVNIGANTVVNIPVKDGWSDLVTKLLMGTIDVVVMPEAHPISQAHKLVSIGPAANCSSGGTMGGSIGLMHRKDVDTKWFSDALQQLKQNNGYSDLCYKWNVDNCSR